MTEGGVSISPGICRRLLLVDGHAFAYRAFYAIPHLSSPSGQPINAVYGFVRILKRTLAAVQPTHVLVVWDGGLDEHRMRLLPEYKAQRPTTPLLLVPQFDQIKRYLHALRIVSHCGEGVEADDWIASVVSFAVKDAFRVVIASSDKDFMQLVSETVALWNPADKKPKFWTPADVLAKSGVHPDQIVDWLSLIGDNVDNIDGVAGVGAVTAAALLARHGSVDGIYRQIHQVMPERLRTALADAETKVRRNQDMIRLKNGLCDSMDWPLLALREPDMSEVASRFQEWGFYGFLKEISHDAAGLEEQMNLL